MEYSLISRGNDIVPLIGSRRHERREEALGNLDVTLPEAIEAAMPESAAAGSRYPEAQMTFLDTSAAESGGPLGIG